MYNTNIIFIFCGHFFLVLLLRYVYINTILTEKQLVRERPRGEFRTSHSRISGKLLRWRASYRLLLDACFQPQHSSSCLRLQSHCSSDVQEYEEYVMVIIIAVEVRSISFVLKSVAQDQFDDSFICWVFLILIIEVAEFNQCKVSSFLLRS